MKKYIVFIAGLLLAIAACKKEQPVPAQFKNYSQLLAGDTAKVWVDIDRSYTLKGNDTVYRIYTPCYTDDNWVFRRNGTYEKNEGASKCNIGDPYVYESGNWKFSADYKSILLSNVTGSDEKSSYAMTLTDLETDKLSVTTVSDDQANFTTPINLIYDTLVPKN